MGRRGALLVTASVLLLAVLAYAEIDPILGALGRYLVIDEPRHPADAILVQSGSVPDRILEAVDLYQAGLAPRIILSRERPAAGLAVLRQRGADMPDRHDINVSIATQLGVPAGALATVDGFATSTRSEAEVVIPYLKHAGIHRVLLVTSKLNARRAGLIFRTLAGDGIGFTVCASRYDSYDPNTWWRHRVFLRRVVFEYEKLAVFQLWERWRSPLTRADK